MSTRVAKRARGAGGQADDAAVNTIRCLAADMVQAANSGHPGAPIGCAPMAFALWACCMTFDPEAPTWWNRDRFVLSNGHACALQYALLHLSGFDLTLDDLKKFRQLDSRTPGHPENFATPGVEVCTGPLGQGICNAIGMAVGQKHMAATYGHDLFNHHVYAIVGDGCLQEGVSAEASSLAGHLKVANLTVLYDSNAITIDGSTELSFTEDVEARYRAYGWDVLCAGVCDSADVSTLVALIEASKKTTKPTLIVVNTTIGFGTHLAGSEKSHGAPLGDDGVAALKTALGMPADKKFHIPEEVRDLFSSVRAANQARHAEWTATHKAWAQANPAQAAELKRRMAGDLPSSLLFPKLDSDKATRAQSGAVIAEIEARLPELFGGSADLSGSNSSRAPNHADFQHGTPGGRYVRFGVREHGMAAIANGLAAYGGFRPFVATFLNFITYAWGAARLAALSRFPVVFVATHDSIELGEDGPTHQPIEVLPMLRATPNLHCMRPADGDETSACWQIALESKATPSVLCLSRGGVPKLARSSLDNVRRGGYTVEKLGAAAHPDKRDLIVLSASGTEVKEALAAAKQLHAAGHAVQVNSFPCWELYQTQIPEYKQETNPSAALRVYIEASSTFGFDTLASIHIGMTSFGASGPATEVRAKFGFSVDAIVAKVKAAAVARK